MSAPQGLKALKLPVRKFKNNGPPGILAISDIATALGLAPSEAFKALKELSQGGLVDTYTVKTSALLIPNPSGCRKFMKS